MPNPRPTAPTSPRNPPSQAASRKSEIATSGKETCPRGTGPKAALKTGYRIKAGAAAPTHGARYSTPALTRNADEPDVRQSKSGEDDGDVPTSGSMAETLETLILEQGRTGAGDLPATPRVRSASERCIGP
jgi:hypothetical protein